MLPAHQCYLRLAAVPSAPLNVKTTQVTSESVTVAWDAPDSDGGTKIKKYIIVMKQKGAKKFKKVGKTKGETLFTIPEGIEPGNEYIIQVYAENEVGIR